MSIKRVKQRSDRGSIKDLVNSQEVSIPTPRPATPAELRLKKLYEHAQNNKNHQMIAALGFITTDYIGDKNALPLSVYRIKQTVDKIKAQSNGKIDQLAQQFATFFKNEISSETISYLALGKARVKIANQNKPPVFRRVIK